MFRIVHPLAVLVAAAAVAQAATPVGWRGDTSGHFPAQNPPTTWSLSEHVVWKTKLPAGSNSSPVVVQGKVFVTAEPTSILCFDAADGALLWQSPHGYDRVLSQSELAAANEQLAQAKQLRQQIDARHKELEGLERQLKDDAANAELKAARDALRKSIERQREELKPLEQYRIPEKAAGCTTPTIISDGQHLYALFGTGIAVCHTLDGKQRWIKLFARPETDWGHTASPLLAGSRLIAQFTELLALDAGSGATQWSVKVPPRYGSPVLARVGSEDWIVTAGADLVRLADGKLLAERITEPLNRSSPIVDGQVAYFVQAKARAFRLSSQADAPAELLWETNLANENYFASPLLLDGLLYTVSENRVLTVLDAANGDPVYQERLKFKQRGAVVSSLVAAGSQIYITNETGDTKVLRAGREYEELAENRLQHLRSSLTFAGGRLYVRTNEHLFCIE